ncbi:MAG: alanine racemase [Acidimicrobiales bacterium]
MSSLETVLSARLDRLRSRIVSAGGDPKVVQVIAVTKGFGPEAVAAATSAGLEVGENFAQELLSKSGNLGERVCWNYLGAIQTNKIRRLAPLVTRWQSVCRSREGEAIALAAPGAEVLVEVSHGGARRGCLPHEVASLVAHLGDLGLLVKGLMAVGPAPPSDPRPLFIEVRRLADDLGLPVRSMGMSEDLEVAVQEGSTMVRTGRALFGERARP